MELKQKLNQIVDLEIFGNVIIFGGIAMFFIGIGLIINEVGLGGYAFCKSVDGDYSLKIIQNKTLSPGHYCNEERIFKYDDGWNFEYNKEFLLEILLP